MSFMYCRLTETDRLKLNSMNLKNLLFPDRPLQTEKIAHQVCDTERNAIFIVVRPEIIWAMVSLFIWNGNICEVHTHNTVKYDMDETKIIVTANWKIDKIYMPEYLSDRIAEVTAMIKKALYVYGEEINIGDMKSKFDIPVEYIVNYEVKETELR